jgi:glycosyltransferase involved in cell wall biosynthesis
LTADGPLSIALGDAWIGAQRASAASLTDAIATRADVIFTHDVGAAEAALAERTAGQQVWVFLHSPIPFALYVAWCWGVPEQSWEEVAAYHDVRTWTAREIRVLERVDRVVVPCRDAAAELIRVDSAYRTPLERATLLLTAGAGPARQHPEASVGELRRRWKLPEDEPVGLFLGSAQPYRGLDIVTAAVARLPGPGELPGAIAVAGVDADRLARHPRLRALGRVREVSDLMAAVDFIINVNRFSLLDLSLIEAIEAGTPMLLSETGGNRTFARLGAGAVLLRELSPTAAAEGLRRMFTLDASAVADLRMQSRSCYESHFTPRHLRDRHVALYDEVAVTTHA